MLFGPTLQPVFVSKKLEQDLKAKETKTSISNALFIILYVISAMQIMSATQPSTFFNMLLNTKIRQSASNFHEVHGRSNLLNESHFKILRKCQGKFDCLVFIFYSAF